MTAAPSGTGGPPSAGSPTTLIVDYGGVLTVPLRRTVEPWLERDRIDPAAFRDLMREWFGAGVERSIGQDLEAGRIDPQEFQQIFAERLRRTDGTVPEAEGILARMFAGFEGSPEMTDVLRAARREGLRTGLLSNSWGFDYDRSGWTDLFDDVVISGEVGLRKPDPEIYRLAAQRLGVPTAACVFVDDLAPNVRGAEAVGMTGVLHRDVPGTLAALTLAFGRTLV